MKDYSSLGRIIPGLLIIVLLGNLLYANALHAPIFSEDNANLLNNPVIHDPGNLRKIWEYSPRKFLAILSFALNYHFGKIDPFGYHLVNIFLHILASCLYYLLLLCIFSAPSLKGTAVIQHRNIVAFFAALVFLAQPLQTQTVTYIWERYTLLSTVFYFGAYIYYLLARLKKAKFNFIVSGFLICAAFFAKGNALTLALLLILSEVFLFNYDLRRIGKTCVKIWPVFLIPIVVVLIHLAKTKIPSGIYFLTQFKAIVYYLNFLAIPFPNIDYNFSVPRSLFDSSAIFCLLIVVIILFIAVLLYKRQRLVSFGIFWIFITLIPVSSVFPWGELILGHRLYLPMAGFALVLAVLLPIAIEQKKACYGVMFCVILLLSELTVARNSLWNTPIPFLQDMVRRTPFNPNPYNALGALYYNDFKMKDAMAALKKAIKLAPDYSAAHNNLGLVYENLGNLDKAEYEFRKAIAIDKDIIGPQINLAYLLLRKNNYSEAANVARQITDTSDQKFTALGNIYSQQDKKQEAKIFFQKALELNPDNSIASFNLANEYFRMKEYPLALSLYQSVVRVQPRFAGAYVNMGVTYYITKDYAHAEEALLKAYELDPDRPELCKNLAHLYTILGSYDKARFYGEKARSLTK